MIKQFKNDALIKLLMAFIAIEAMMASILAIAESNIEIDKAIQQAREEIKMNGHRKGHHILIVKAVTKDQKAFTGQQVFGVKAELQRWLGYRRRSISNDEYKFYIGKPGVTYELRVMAPGYHQFSREITFGEEQVVIWENVVLEPVTSDTASTITGTLWLESSKDKLGGVIVRADDSRTITDDNGRFTLSGLRSADLTISAKVEGYIGLGEWVNLKKASKINVDLKGYRKRKYKIEWAHQDSGSWDSTKIE